MSSKSFHKNGLSHVADTDSVADPDPEPGSGAFVTPGSGDEFREDCLKVPCS
jgi:hypothetical protein